TVVVAEDASLTTDASDIETTIGITNNGDLIFIGGTNNNEITGDGDLTIEGSVTNNNSIEQDTILITKDGSLVTDADNLVTDTEVRNVGELEFTGGTNENTITGDGSLKVSGDVANEASVKQSEIEITEDGSLVTDVNNVVATDGITNDGSLTYTGNSTNKNEIAGDGDLTIDGTIENATGTSIDQNSVTVNDSGSLTANADDITTDSGIVNEGTLTYTGGTNENNISGEGNLVVDGIVENVTGTTIEQEKITVEEDSTFVTDANDLDISDNITLAGDKTVLNLKDEQDAELETTITGSGKIVKEGEGTVTLSGNNDYAGTTTITDGAIAISSADNISENTIYMGGGKLIIDNDTEMELGNEIMGTDHNDVNIEATGEKVTLTNEIFGNENLVKTGSGIIEFQSETNSYAGDTKIEEGGIIGNTANIKGTVTGNGEGTSVEFNDDGDDVTLNTIENIGLFEKTGSATMTVDKDFTALNANITEGTFVINNDSEMGGSGSTFEVSDTMRLNDSTLKGYGNIKTGDLIIGENASLAPGNSTTTFKVEGNLRFEDNGNYDVEFGQTDMDSKGHFNDNTQVSGTTTIGEDATLTLNNLKGKYYVAETIELINSGTLEDGYEYKEGNVVFNDNDSSDLRPGYETRISTRVYTEGSALKLDLQRKRSEYSDTLEFERSHNEQEAAKAIDAVSTGNDGDITIPLDAMEKMFYYQDTYDIDGLKAALNDIAGVIHSNATNLTFFNAKAEHVYDKIKERTKDILPCNKVHDKIWAEYYYNNYNVDKDENSPKQELSVNGFLVGFDMINSKNWTMGIMGGYGTSELKQKKDKADMKDINLGLYGGYESDKWLLKGMLLGGYEQYDITRKIAFMDRTATSEHKGYSGALDLEAGYKISLNRDNQAKHRMYLKPFIGATGSYMNNEGYEEKGADSLNLKVNDYSEFAAEARAGLELNGKVKRFGWYVKAGARQLLTEDYREIELSLLDYADITKMNIRSAKNARTTLMGGIGADYDLSENWTIFANGLGNFADVSTNYYANVGLAYRFGCKNNKKEMMADNEYNAEEEELRKQLEEAKVRERELQDKIQEQEATIVNAQQAEQKKQQTIKKIKLDEKPTFVFGTDKLTSEGKARLEQVVQEIANYPNTDVLIEGHTDNVGKDEYNQRLSERRAYAIAVALKRDYKVKNSVFITGKGEKEPIATNDTKEGRAQNRRVAISLTAAE
ncbi:MAG: autotransporter domain-containing protein, partial [Elusimicrobia bacterium]|nr:autotransporter domain-containing protein [Elusimicrobiota bacterium]